MIFTRKQIHLAEDRSYQYEMMKSQTPKNDTSMFSSKSSSFLNDTRSSIVEESKKKEDKPGFFRRVINKIKSDNKETLPKEEFK